MTHCEGEVGRIWPNVFTESLKNLRCALSEIRAASISFLACSGALISHPSRIICSTVRLREAQESWCCGIIAENPITERGANEQRAQSGHREDCPPGSHTT
jgi:hypothetical protein